MADAAPAIVHGRASLPVDLPIVQGPPTGYGWSLDLPPGVVRIEDGPPKPETPGQHLGGSSGNALRVVVASKGRYRITARLVRPWAPDDAARTVVIDLIVE